MNIEEFGLVRVDDRLIHGQVIAGWCKHKPFTHIVIVDDGTAADPFMRQVLSLAAPGLHIGVMPVEEGSRILAQDAPQRSTTMVLVKSPLVARELYDRGVKFKRLNVGGIGSAPGRKSLFKNISASAEEIAALKYLQAQGVEITLLTVPGEQSVSFAHLANRL